MVKIFGVIVIKETIIVLAENVKLMPNDKVFMKLWQLKYVSLN